LYIPALKIETLCAMLNIMGEDIIIKDENVTNLKSNYNYFSLCTFSNLSYKIVRPIRIITPKKF